MLLFTSCVQCENPRNGPEVTRRNKAVIELGRSVPEPTFVTTPLLKHSMWRQKGLIPWQESGRTMIQNGMSGPNDPGEVSHRQKLAPLLQSGNWKPPLQNWNFCA